MSEIFPERKLWIVAALGVTLFNAKCGGFKIFQCGELFITPRLFAEAGVLAALAAALRGNVLSPCILILTAAAIHPIIVATGGLALAVTAMDYLWRSRALRVLNTRDFVDKPEKLCYTKFVVGNDGPTDEVQIRNACRALSDLDAMISFEDVPGTVRRSKNIILFKRQIQGLFVSV